MFTLTVGVIPGAGAREISIQPGTTLADIARSLDLTGRQFVVSGDTIAEIDWATHRITDPNTEIFAVAPAKGA